MTFDEAIEIIEDAIDRESDDFVEVDDVPVRVRSRRNMRNMRMTFDKRDGILTVRCPYSFDPRVSGEAMGIVLEWFDKVGTNQYALSMAEKILEANEPKCLEALEAVRTADELKAMVREWALKMSLEEPNRITVRTTKTIFGSCSIRRNITLSKDLLYMNREYAEYIVVHELAHLVHMNHSEDFWNLVREYLPNCDALDDTIDAHWCNLRSRAECKVQ